MGLAALWLISRAAAIDGVPLTRFYPYEEIGCSAGGAQLVHDAFGRIVVAREGELAVLNDSIWRKLWSGHGAGNGLRQVARDHDGTIYIGGLGGWGKLQLLPDGNLEPLWIPAPEAPGWVRATIFDKILCTPDGVYFGGLHGVVFRERATGAHHYFEIGGVSCLFPLQGAVLVSTFDNGMHAIDARRDRLEPVPPGVSGHEIAWVAAGDGSDGSLVGSVLQQLFIQRNGSLVPLPGRAARKVPGRIVALLKLPEERYAAAISGFGIITIQEDGTIRTLLSGPEYEGITSLANAEPGVLWAATERGVVRILYGQPLTTFDRTLGLPIDWPQVVFWRGSVIVGSGGRIYESEPPAEFRPARFRRIAGEPPVGAWAIAQVGDSLLLGNGDGVFETTGGGSFQRIVSDLRVGRLVALDRETVLAIGTERIAMFRRLADGWSECAPRVAGVGYPYIVHTGNGGAWLELGVNRAARVSFSDGKLRVKLFEEFPWQESGWINASVVGTTAILCGASDTPLLLDDRTLQPVDVPVLREVIARVPWRVQRVCEAASGDLWISHERGLCLARKQAGRYELDLDSYAGVNGPTPLVSLAPAGGGAWASTGSALHHLEPSDRRVGPSGHRPVLVGLRDVRAKEAVAITPAGQGDLGALRYEQNGIQLEFFSGSYANVRPLAYEHSLDGGAWLRADTPSSLVLPGLREGPHLLRVRLLDELRPVGRLSEFRFTILPPWYRRWYAYAVYALAFAFAIGGIVRLAALWARRRHAALERLVAERTRELRAAMERLERETLTSATLAERNRLAAEIHDSLEQGFAGLGLQLETTASLGGCSREVQAGLAAARNMVAYCHQEVRHAVQGMHSPILEAVDLGAALTRLAAQLAPTSDFAAIRVEGEPRRIDPAAEHHLLRIAQEAIANAVKHAAARHLEIVLAYHAEEIALLVRDDGRGFETAEVLRGARGHLGVPSLRSRAAKIGGTIAITSRPGQGTTIEVRVPLGKPAAIPS
ncbi:MAG: sensor histidine kinase [Opitutaceae bacterium]